MVTNLPFSGSESANAILDAVSGITDTIESGTDN